MAITHTNAQLLTRAAQLLDNDTKNVTGGPAMRCAMANTFRDAGVNSDLFSDAVLHAAREVIEIFKPPIDTMNDFLVGTNGDYVTIQMPPQLGQLLDTDLALRFAAWLVMFAGLGEVERFDEIMEAIRNTWST